MNIAITKLQEDAAGNLGHVLLGEFIVASDAEAVSKLVEVALDSAEHVVEEVTSIGNRFIAKVN